jgi:hypothetical protein
VGALATVFGIGLLGSTAFAAAPRQGKTPGAGQDSTQHPVRLLGRVESVSSTGLVLLTRRGDVNVNAGDRTWIVVERDGRCAQGTLQDIQTGRPAEVMGMTTAITSTIDARVIVQARCAADAANGQKAKGQAIEALAKHVAVGTVKAINGTALTVTREKNNKDVTVNTTADTVVLNNGFKTVSSIKVGDKVEVLGRPDKSATGTQPSITAWGLHVASAGTQLAVGHVDAVNGNTITLRTPKHKEGIPVTLDASTEYRTLTITNNKPSLANASQAAVTAGSNLIVEGVSATGGKSFTARSVIVLPTAGRKQ